MRRRQYTPKPAQDTSVLSSEKLLQTRPFQPEINNNQQAPQLQEETEALTGSFDLTQRLSSFDPQPISTLSQSLQAKLAIGEPNDKYEQEADRVAHDVVQRIHKTDDANDGYHPLGQLGKHADAVRRKAILQRETMLEEEDELQMKPLETLQREVLEEDDELQMKPLVQRKGTEGGAASAEVEQGINRARSGGQSLAPKLQAQMGQAIGADFSGVRVHTDARADALNRSVGARAFTTGQDLFFKQGEYQPGSRGGQELIAHELTHVVQQNRKPSAKESVQRSLDPTFGDENYRREASINLKFEEEVGKALISDAQVKNYALAIRNLSGSPLSTWEMTPKDIEELSHMVGPIGGAHDLAQDKDTLDAHVLATHIKIDRAEFNDPNAPNPLRRQNMFNRVVSPDNPIYPWNIHDFDKGLHEIDTWDKIPKEIADLITHRWEEFRLDDESYAKVLSLQSLDNVVGLGGMKAEDIFGLLTQQERKVFLYEILHIKWSTTTYVNDETVDSTSRDISPLGADYRQHNTGDKANVVMGSDPQDPKVAEWIQEAIGFNKPIISGPSGHSLRYLNHWATIRMVNHLLGAFLGHNLVNSLIFPSLAEARLVMMANLMPPKNHHSYHEIMLASIGISDGIDTLRYNHKDSYQDLNETPVGRKVFQQATQSLQVPNSEPLPNPWKREKELSIAGWPPSNAQDLFGILYRFAKDRDTAEVIIMSTTQQMRMQLIPLVQQAVFDGQITSGQKQVILDIIYDIDVPKPVRVL